MELTGYVPNNLIMDYLVNLQGNLVPVDISVHYIAILCYVKLKKIAPFPPSFRNFDGKIRPQVDVRDIRREKAYKCHFR